MKKHLQITDFEKQESFLQVNTIKGFKYIDRAGELVNFFHSPDNKPPKFNMNMQGLVLSAPEPGIQEFKISPDNIWMKGDPKLDAIHTISTFNEKALAVLKILEVNEISRIGWRTVFSYLFDDEEKLKAFFNKLLQIPGIGESEIHAKLETGKDFKAHLRFFPAVKASDNKKFLIFDIDVYKEGSALKVSDLKPSLTSFWDYIKSPDGFFRTVNGFAEKFNG